MLKSLKSFIFELQQLDEQSKMKWLLGMTALTVALVIFLWVIYLNATVASVDDSKNNQFSNWDVFKAGLVTISEKVESGVINSYLFFHDKLNQGTTFTITK